MPNFVRPTDKSDGQIITGTIWNEGWKRLEDYLNNGGNAAGIGNNQVTTNPAEKIAGSKIDLASNPDFPDHSARHEPGGVDEIGNIDILNTGTLLSAHVSRHVTGGADPLPASSLDGSVLIPGTIPQGVTVQRKKQESFIQNALGLAADPLYPRLYTLSNTTANAYGRGVVRGGILYCAVIGLAPDAVLKIDIDTATETIIPMSAGQAVDGLVLIGTNIYVLVSGAAQCKIRKIDNADAVTDVVDLNSGAAPNDLTSTQSLRCDGPGTRLFCIASNAGLIYFVSVNADGTALTKTSGGAATAKYGLAYAKRGSEERLWTIDATTTLLRRNVDGTANASLALGGTAARRLLYDGENLIVAFNGAGATHQIIDPWATTMKAVALIANPTTISTAGSTEIDNLSLDVLGDFDLFDGRAAHFHGRSGTTPEAGLISIYPSEGYRAIARLTSHGGPYSPSSLAADGTYIYANYTLAGGDCRLRRMLRD